MKTFRKNTFGFAHHALLGVLVVAIIALAGVRVLTASHALQGPPGPQGPVGPSTFSPAQDHAFANSEHYATIDVGVYQSDSPKKVVFYRGGNLIASVYTHTKAGNGYKEHFKYIWNISGATAKSYHWTAKVYSSYNYSFLAQNNKGQKYLDTLVIGNGSLSDSKFIVPDNNAVWKSCDQSKFLRVEIKLAWDGTSDVNDRNFNDVSMIKGVQFINTSVNNPIHYEVPGHAYAYIHGDDTRTHKYVGYDYYPVGAAQCLPKGDYNWIARVIDTNGGSHLAQEHDDDNVYHLNLTVE